MEGVLWLVFGWRAENHPFEEMLYCKVLQRPKLFHLTIGGRIPAGWPLFSTCELSNSNCQSNFCPSLLSGEIHIQYCTFCPQCSDGTFVPMQHQDLEFPSTRRSSGYSEGHSTVTRKAGYQRAPWCTRDPPLRHVNDTAAGRYPHRSQWHFIYIYIYTCILICMYTYYTVCIYVCMYLFMHTHVYMYVYIYIYIWLSDHHTFSGCQYSKSSRICV